MLYLKTNSHNSSPSNKHHTKALATSTDHLIIPTRTLKQPRVLNHPILAVASGQYIVVYSTIALV